MDTPHKTNPSFGTEDADTAQLEKRMRIELKDIGIPPRPAILEAIDREMAKDDPNFAHLARLIGADVALAAGLIKITNSPYYGFGKKVRTVQEALLVLGLRVIVKTVAGLALQNLFKNSPKLERFWDASAKIASLSAWLAQQLRGKVAVRPEDAYTFGLFRDCGIPILLIPFPEYESILRQANHSATEGFTEIEDRLLSINHCVVGAELAEGWYLPAEIVEAIRHHHDPAAYGLATASSASGELAAIGQLAEEIVQRATQLGQTAEWSKLGAACLAVLQLDTADFETLATSAVAARSWEG
jgi:HD-like signal output (HDOD) protein